jgi:hypothetical protein
MVRETITDGLVALSYGARWTRSSVAQDVEMHSPEPQISHSTS